MQELKKIEAKPEPTITIPMQNLYEYPQSHFHGSLPDLNSIQVNYTDHQSVYPHSTSNHS